MSAVRRPRRTVAFVEPREVVDLGVLLRGELRVVTEDRLFVANLLEGREEGVSREELLALLSISRSEWTPLPRAAAQSGLTEEELEELARRGLLLSDRAEEPFSELRRRDQELEAVGWYPWAAVYHFMGRWETDLLLPPEEVREEVFDESNEWVDELVERFGPPPPALYERADAVGRVDLPRSPRSDGLFGLLGRRRTDRSYDRTVCLPLEQFATVVETVYGCQGARGLHEELTVLKKSSPSGGALHPVEIYPLVRDVEGLAPGLYHYAAGSHRLELLRAMSAGEVEDTVEAVTSGQSYYRSAHACFVLTARFARTFWKYRGHAKAYRVVLLDAGHLSQTLYLVACELGLGAFFTAAVNDGAAEEALGLDRCREGVLGVSGCGVVAPDADRLAFVPEPYPPGG